MKTKFTFTIPRYLWRTYYMGVYKKGYIVWNDETIFNPTGDGFVKRPNSLLRGILNCFKVQQVRII